MRAGITYLSPSPDISRATTQQKYREFFSQVEWANEQGFSGIWITEHHFSTYSISASPLVLLTKAATIAPDLRIGTGILVLPLWDPRRLVADISTLDVLSGGRVDLGIGRGYQPHEFHGFGRDLATSRAVFEEHVDLTLRLFTESDIVHQGAHYGIDAPITVLPRPEQTPHPPVWVAAVTPESTRFGAARGFGFLGLALATPAELAAQWQQVTALRAEAGATTDGIGYAANRFVICTMDPEVRRGAIREVARQIQLSSRLGTGSGQVTGGALGATSVDPADEELIAQRVLGGTPDEIIEQLAAIGEAGVTAVNAAFQYGALPGDVADASARLFAAEVLPALAETAPAPAAVAGPVPEPVAP